MKTKHDFLIFIVDDNKMFLDTLEYQIKKNMKDNVRVEKFSSGEDCLKQMHLNPNVVILDYLLDSLKPGAMNGIDVLKKIKSKNSKIIVLMLSSQDNIEIAVNTIKYEAFDYIVKNESAFMKVQITLNIIKKEISLTWKLKQLKNSLIALILVGLLAVIVYILLSNVFNISF